MLLAHCCQAAAREDATHQLRGRPLAAAMSPRTTQGVETRTRMARTKTARAPRQSTVQRGPVSAVSTLPQPCSFARFAFASRVQQQLTTMLVCAQRTGMPKQTCNERAWPAASLATGALFSCAVALSKPSQLCGTCAFMQVTHHPPVGLRPGRSTSTEILPALHSDMPATRSPSPVSSLGSKSRPRHRMARLTVWERIQRLLHRDLCRRAALWTGAHPV